ncbi:chaplin [Streptomyces sp. NPDC050803]|uniref:chaplin n=1 Tax=unclassified Streptomyces TaxID=2593676 RepID=UPI0034395422
MVAAAAATSILSLCGSPALADTGASGATKDSPGVLSGNNVQAPVEVPVNACGNSGNLVAALNPAFGNSCANGSDSDKSGGYGSDYGSDEGGSGTSAHGSTEGSPGVGSGNNTQVPVDVPVNLCGNTVDVISALNPAYGNDCENGGDSEGGYGDTPTTPPHTTPPHTTPPHTTPPPTTTPPHTTPPPTGGDQPPPTTTPPHTTPPTTTPPSTTPPPPGGDQPPGPPGGPPPTMPDTGSNEAMLAASGASAALIAAGAVLYRRGRAASRR